MNLHSLRRDLQNAVDSSSLSQREFADRHGLSYSTLNKFLKGHLLNLRYSTFEEFERATRLEASRAERSMRREVRA